MTVVYTDLVDVTVPVDWVVLVLYEVLLATLYVFVAVTVVVGVVVVVVVVPGTDDVTVDVVPGIVVVPPPVVTVEFTVDVVELVTLTVLV